MHRVCVLILALFAALLMTGCSMGNSSSATPPPASNPGSSAGQLTLSPSAFTFGSVLVGSSKSQTATLTAGSSSVTVSSADWSGQGFSLSGITFPVTIAAGKSVSFNVLFAPTTGGSVSTTLSILSSNASTVSSTMTGSGALQHKVSLSWSPVTSVSGYNVYRGAASSGPFTRLNGSLQTASNFVDATVASGATYYYVATSVTNSTESSYSSPVQAAIPSP